jgi:site-specific DNA recombinase
MKPPRKCCAIYTRKSSEEGLDQEFNSLDAQREAGEAYVKSQASEGWALLPARYDDGGFSGGTMERPALRRLLADIEAGLIDVIVVYKIDRLTRSLADFARMVELFDKQHVSFVSVTQSFNTTSSMGRLTLNVLLSFAQFEREVTGERIRDKIAASKAKGMWMGGTLPLGYGLPTDTARALVVNDAEAALVRRIFTDYLKLTSVHALARQLAQEGIVTKIQQRRDGSARGGVPFSRGALFHLLRNRTYIGKIVHKDKFYPGAHDAIVDEGLFNDVQAILDANAQRSASAKAPVDRALLVGRLFDEDGNPMSPSFSRGKSGKLYRYYVSAPLQQGARMSGDAVRRVSARAIEALVSDTIAQLLPDHADPVRILQRVELARGALHLMVPAKQAVKMRLGNHDGLQIMTDGGEGRVIIATAICARAGTALVRVGKNNLRRDPAMIGALRRARAMLGKDNQAMPVIDAAPASPYLRTLVRLAFLAPDIQRDILGGRQPHHLTLQHLIRMDLPSSWSEQRAVLDWPERVG